MTAAWTARVVHRGLGFGEAPRWHAERLWFSDFYRHGVYSLGPDGERLELPVANQPSGLGWQPDGTLLVVSMTDHRVLAVAPTGRVSEHADLTEYCGYWANDLVVGRDGTAYVGNFGLDLDAWIADPDRGLLASTNLVVLAPGGEVAQVVDGLVFPNGAVLSEDGRTLVVAETMARRLTAFDVAADGTLWGRRVFAEVPHAFPDGICLDANGDVWVATAIRPEVLRVREGGEVTGRVATSKVAYACVLGGAARRTLHVMTAPTSTASVASGTREGCIEAVDVDVPGAGIP